MAASIDILHLFPELVAIGQSQLQVYCDEWLRRPIAREFGFAQLTVDDQLQLHIGTDRKSVGFVGDRAYLPIDELLGYIIDRHLPDLDERHRLHTSIRDVRKRWSELGRDYEISIGRVGILYLTCKNPQCHAVMETDQQAREGQRINYGPTDIECLTCGQTHSYDGRDFKLKIAK